MFSSSTAKNSKIILVLDCGATNVRTVAINDKGEILASQSLQNNTQPDPENPGYRIWDVGEIWDKFKRTTAGVLKQINKKAIAGITVTTFGVDGAPFSKTGKMIHPVISWQCRRTAPVMEQIGKYIPLTELYQENGVQSFHFNTLNKLIWLKENKPEVLEKTGAYLLLPSIFLYYLTGEMVTDTSMAGTSMLTQLNKRDFSDKIFQAIGLNPELFPRLVEPGTVIGQVTSKAEKETGIPSGIPVVATGHDTQFAIFGSGARENVPVLSSGTWDILMVRTSQAHNTTKSLTNGVTIEFDPIPGLYNPGVQWVASGMLEWIRKMFFSELHAEKSGYEKMIAEAEKVAPGCRGLRFKPDFLPEEDPAKRGSVTGISLNTSRGEIYRAALESLAFRTASGLKILEETGGFSAQSLICVGGGSKNLLWNQIRADVLGLPLKVISQSETTVLGAALFVMSGIGLFETPEEAREIIDYPSQVIEPGKNRKIYSGL